MKMITVYIGHIFGYGKRQMCKVIPWNVIPDIIDQLHDRIHEISISTRRYPPELSRLLISELMICQGHNNPHTKTIVMTV